MTIDQLVENGIVPSDEQLHCCHILGVTTIKNDAYLINKNDTVLFGLFGGIEFSYCPMCGMRLK